MNMDANMLETSFTMKFYYFYLKKYRTLIQLLSSWEGQKAKKKERKIMCILRTKLRKASFM